MSEPARFSPVVPGASVPKDWYDGAVPLNVEVGEGSVVDSSHTFKHFASERQPGLRLGERVTIWRASLATDVGGLIEVGDDTYIANASVVAGVHISIGSRVLVCGGATIVDCDFHPLPVTDRIADSIALAPGGDRRRRPAVQGRPVHIEDDVWVGWNAVVLPGVRIGRGAVLSPGAVVTSDVAPRSTVAGNPARPLAPLA